MKKFLCYDTNDAVSGKINVSTNGMLKANSTVPPLPNGSASYQQLVTDGSGEAKWEERLAYEENKLVVAVADDYGFVKVSDDIPSWASINVPIKVWLSSGGNFTESSEDYADLGNGSFAAVEFVIFITTDNVEVNGIVFQKKGMYFAKKSEVYVSGIASADSDTPEITWDGSFREVKKIDEKFLPEQGELPVFTVKKVGVAVSINYLFDAEGDLMTAEQANSIGLNFVVQTDGGITKPISMVRFDDYVCFYIPQVGEGTLKSIACYTEGYSVIV